MIEQRAASRLHLIPNALIRRRDRLARAVTWAHVWIHAGSGRPEEGRDDRDQQRIEPRPEAANTLAAPVLAITKAPSSGLRRR